MGLTGLGGTGKMEQRGAFQPWQDGRHRAGQLRSASAFAGGDECQSGFDACQGLVHYWSNITRDGQ
jgi:hypothetical protein